MSDNRSFISDNTRFHNGSFVYGRAYDEQSRSPVPKLQTAFRQIPTPGPSRHVPSAASLSPVFHDPGRVNDSGPYGTSPDVHTPVTFSQALHHSPSYRDQYSQMNSPSYYSPAEGSLPYTYPQPTSRVTDACSLASHSSSSHSPPAAPEQRLPSAQEKSPTTYIAPRSTPKRREKPRIALAPDQPLTTQGKPRARVYVACVQCRTRKIRCDGAKPTCHNCSRRTANGSEPLTPCQYDAAPKRRGPDKNPGSRQRLTTQEITEGGKVRRRRRRDTMPTDRTVPMTAQASSAPSSNVTGNMPHAVMTQIRPPNVLTSAVEALTRAPPEVTNTSHTLGKSDPYHGAQQPGVVQTAGLTTSPSNLIPSAGSISHPSSALQHIVPVNEPQFPQVRVLRTVPSYAAVPV
ncbi:hypothetical protein NM688_g9048 [Phlebia brevispora]|uniref:Uncharacterized protein n=1 Tax=Phlebia brevispora TaxID=194682 RepID=A0ACC1RL61_9APHY|nr:hypothetical protein NM688_g9048 [Phlebia brevispora]